MAVKYKSLQELISVAECFESVIVGTTKGDSMPRPHPFPDTTACPEPLSGPPSHVFPVGHLITSQVIPGNDQNTSPTNQKTAGSKLERTS